MAHCRAPNCNCDITRGPADTANSICDACHHRFGLHPIETPAAPPQPAPAQAFDMSQLRKEIRDDIKREVQPMSLTLHNLESKIQPISLTLHNLESKIAAFEFTGELTPTQAGHSKDDSPERRKYNNLIQALDLLIEEPAPKLIESKLKPLCWTWPESVDSTAGLESTAYAEVCKYLESVLPRFRAIGVGFGELFGPDLFKTMVYTLRPKAGVHGENLIKIMDVHGRTDVIVFGKDVMPRTGRPNVLKAAFVIEIKTPKTMTVASANSAVTQLIGLNSGNPHASPPVLLTNLRGTNNVFYATMRSPEPLQYSVAVQPCSTFARSIEFIMSLLDSPQLSYRKSVTVDLGREPSPIASSATADSSKQSELELLTE